MATKSVELQKTFLLDRRTSRLKWFARLDVESLSSQTRIRDSLVHASKDTLWISFEKTLTEALLKSVDWPSPSLGAVLLLHRPDAESLPALSDCFRKVVFSFNDGFLSPEELGEVLVAENRANLFIGGTVNPISKTITLWRGNLSSLTVPFNAFEPSGTGTKPEFSEFSITDYGHTIKLGSYEAASDAVLYEFDPNYRRQQAKARIATEKTFGASLRRLRKQRGLRREDFAPLSPKTIARIEQGKVERVHSRTLGAIAKKLGVRPEEIEEY
jgi:DNA-binding Xre family transcriptional regulator